MAIDEQTFEQDADGLLTAEGGPLDFNTFMQDTGSDLKAFVSAKKDELLLTASEKAAKLIVKFIHSAILVIVMGTVVLFFNIALAIYLGYLFGSHALGFVMVACIYLLLFGIYSLWWNASGRNSAFLSFINELTDGPYVQEH